MNAILYLLKSGCHWRLTPKNTHPGKRFMANFADGRKRVSGLKCTTLSTRQRKEMGKTTEPSVHVVDSHSVKTGKVAAIKSRGYDGVHLIALKGEQIMRQSNLDDRILKAQWEIWRFQINPTPDRLPSPAAMQRATQTEALERLARRITVMR